MKLVLPVETQFVLHLLVPRKQNYFESINYVYSKPKENSDVFLGRVPGGSLTSICVFSCDEQLKKWRSHSVRTHIRNPFVQKKLWSKWKLSEPTNDPWPLPHDPYPMTLIPWPLPHDLWTIPHTTWPTTNDQWPLYVCMRLLRDL